MPRADRQSKQSASDFGDARKFAVLAALLVLGVLAVFLQSCDFGLVTLDDPTYVGNNSHVQEGLNFGNIAWSFGQFHDRNWIPLTWLSLMLDSDVYSGRIGGYHLTNVLLHTANSVLLFAVLAWMTGNQNRSAFVAALFALHPLHVESVAWVAERKDVLSIFFGLLSLLAYVGYVKRARLRHMMFCFVLFLCSLLSKQTLVTLPFLLLLLDFWPLDRFDFWSTTQHAGDAVPFTRRARIIRLILEKVPFLAGSAAFSVVALVAQKSVVWHANERVATLAFSARLMNAAAVYVAYLWKMLVPFDLAVFYPHPVDNLSPGIVMVASTFLLATSLAAIGTIKRRPYFFVGWFWYLGTLVPMIGIVQVGSQQMADRYTYFPLIGVFIAIVWFLAELAPAGILRERVLPISGVTALVVLSAFSFVQVGYWEGSVTLFRHALQCEPNDPVTMGFLGYALVSQGNPAQAEEGISLLEAAVKIPPPSAKSHYNLAAALQKIGRNDQAAAQYLEAIAIDDSDPETHNNLAVILSSHRRFEEARQHLRRAIEIDPSYVQSYVNLGVVCVMTGDYAGAIDACQRALEIDPDMLGCHYTMALALRAQGRFDESIKQFEMLLSVVPTHQQARQELARTRAMKSGAAGS